MRPLTAALCLKRKTESEIILTGEPRMKERPILHLVDALRQAGADIRYLENEGYPPLAIRNKGIKVEKSKLMVQFHLNFDRTFNVCATCRK